MQDKKNISRLADLRKADRTTLFVNLITLYRTATFPILMLLIFTNQLNIFKWMIIISFLTDSIDGFMARKYKVNSVLGAKLDSIGDDLTVLAAIVGLAVFKTDFLKEQWLAISIPLSLFFIQTLVAYIRYKRMSSFHTYLAKLAAVLQGFFLCAMFLFKQPAYWLFYTAIIITTLELIEEIIIVLVLPQWKTNVHGLYWALKEK